MTLITRSVASPIGDLLLVGDGTVLCGLYLDGHRRAPVLEGAVDDPGAFPEAVAQLDEWFEGRRTTFALRVEGRGSDFQQAVWRVLTEIPFGGTMTYGEVAARAGRPGCARAVGSAVARNPVSIVVPCHRVVGAGGTLTGYAGGLDRKRWLLEHERLVTTGAGRPDFAG